MYQSNRKRWLRNAEAGITLLEILVAVAIFGLLSLTGVSHFLALSDSVRRANARSEVETNLRRAQNEAVAKGAKSLVTIASNGKSFSVGFDYLPYSTPAVVEESYLLLELPTGVTLSSSGQILYDSRGFLVDDFGNPQTITLTLSQNGTPFSVGTLFTTGVIQFPT